MTVITMLTVRLSEREARALANVAELFTEVASQVGALDSKHRAVQSATDRLRESLREAGLAER